MKAKLKLPKITMKKKKKKEEKEEKEKKEKKKREKVEKKNKEEEEEKKKKREKEKGEKEEKKKQKEEKKKKEKEEKRKQKEEKKRKEEEKKKEKKNKKRKVDEPDNSQEDPKSISTPPVENGKQTMAFENGNGGDFQETDDGNGNGEVDGGGSAAKAFQRVKADEWIGKKGSWNNTYEATFGAGGWGFKAQQILGQVRGKDFRHEKTKKKRGTYRGGSIDPTARFSYKFSDSDDE